MTLLLRLLGRFFVLLFPLGVSLTVLVQLVILRLDLLFPVFGVTSATGAN